MVRGPVVEGKRGAVVEELRGTVRGVDGTFGPPTMAEPTLLNLVEELRPRNVTARMHTTAIKATRRNPPMTIPRTGAALERAGCG